MEEIEIFAKSFQKRKFKRGRSSFYRNLIKLVWLNSYRNGYSDFVKILTVFEKRASRWLLVYFLMWNFKSTLYYPKLFSMNFNEVIQLIWIYLSCPEVNSSKKTILEYRPNFKKVSILPNLEWGKYPFGIASYVEIEWLKAIYARWWVRTWFICENYTK